MKEDKDLRTGCFDEGGLRERIHELQVIANKGPQPLPPTPRDSEDWEASDQEIERLCKALRAIVARIWGVWDHPDLMAFGPLSNTNEDITAIASRALNTPSCH